MTARQGIRLASRVLCLFFFVNSFFDLLDLPWQISTWFRVLMMHSALTEPALTQTYFLIRMVMTFAVNLTLAVLFYRCGPGVARFLLPEVHEVTDERHAEGTA